MLYQIMKLVAKSPGHHMSTSRELEPNPEADDIDQVKMSIISKNASSCSFLGNEPSVGGIHIQNERKGSHIYNLKDNIASAKEGRQLYFDNSIVKVKVPEAIVRFDNIDDQTVKDICIDEGIHSINEVVLENTDVSTKLSSVPEDIENAKSDLHGEADDIEIIKDLKMSPIFHKDHEDQISSLNFTNIGGKANNANKATTGIVVQKISLQELFDLEKSTSDPQHDPRNLNNHNDHKRFSSPKRFEEVKLEEANYGTRDFNIATIDSTQDKELAYLNDLNLIRSTKQCESSKVSGRRESPTNDLLEGTSRTMHSALDDANTSTIENVINTETECGIDNTNANCDQGKFIISENSRDELAFFRTSSARNSYYHNNQRELYEKCPFSGPKYSSGHIAFSGSTSLRSDSSTASTRSFAFPVLQTEWNSSPVRMAKAECRRRSWLTRIICCELS